jgi:hypothetical protein
LGHLFLEEGIHSPMQHYDPIFLLTKYLVSGQMRILLDRQIDAKEQIIIGIYRHGGIREGTHVHVLKILVWGSTLSNIGHTNAVIKGIFPVFPESFYQLFQSYRSELLVNLAGAIRPTPTTTLHQTAGERAMG